MGYSCKRSRRSHGKNKVCHKEIYFHLSYVTSFMLRKSCSVYKYCMQYYVHQTHSEFTCFMCRTERLQDFARLFTKDISVKSAETHSPSPRTKQQKRVDDKNNSFSSKMVSTAKFYFYTRKCCYNSSHNIKILLIECDTTVW